MYECFYLCVHLYTSCVLVLGEVVSLHVELGIEPGSFATIIALNHWTNSPVPDPPFLSSGQRVVRGQEWPWITDLPDTPFQALISQACTTTQAWPSNFRFLNLNILLKTHISVGRRDPISKSYPLTSLLHAPSHRWIYKTKTNHMRTSQKRVQKECERYSESCEMPFSRFGYELMNSR